MSKQLKEYLVNVTWQTTATIRVKTIDEFYAADTALVASRYNTIEQGEKEVSVCVEIPPEGTWIALDKG